MNFSIDELNHLIYRYLQDSGYKNTAFTFINEAKVGRANVNRGFVPASALLCVIQKGLQYTKVEISVSLGEVENEHPLVKPLSLLDAVNPDIFLQKAQQNQQKQQLQAQAVVPINRTVIVYNEAKKRTNIE